MFISNSRLALALALALIAGPALAAGINGVQKPQQPNRQLALLPSTPVRPLCDFQTAADDPYCANYSPRLAQRSTPVHPLCDFQTATDDPYCSNYSPRLAQRSPVHPLCDFQTATDDPYCSNYSPRGL